MLIQTVPKVFHDAASPVIGGGGHGDLLHPALLHVILDKLVELDGVPALAVLRLQEPCILVRHQLLRVHRARDIHAAIPYQFSIIPCRENNVLRPIACIPVILRVERFAALKHLCFLPMRPCVFNKLIPHSNERLYGELKAHSGEPVSNT